MKILINYPIQGEAGPAFSLELAKGFQKNGHEVYAVLIEDVINQDEWLREFPEDHIFFVRSHQKGNHLAFAMRILSMYCVDHFKWKKIFRKKHIDVSIRTMYTHWGLAIDRAVKAKKTVAFCHDPQKHSGFNSLYTPFNYANIHKADDVFVLTRSFAPLVAELYKKPVERVHYVPHGRMSMYQANDELPELQKQYQKKYHFLFFGRIEKYKGLHVLAKAYELLRKEFDDAELTILGSGDFEEYKEEYAKLPDVHVVNRFIKTEELGNYFALNNTITVMPYIDATQSGVIPVAFEFGTPIISSDVGGLKEQLDGGRLGAMYTDNDPEQLYQLMLEAVTNEDYFSSQKAMLLKERDRLEWTNIAKRILEEIGMSETGEKR